MEESIFRCPIYAAPLAFDAHCYVCPSRHSFDRAKSGYVNLLPPSSPGAGHGDDRFMVAARRDFLEKGYYRPMADALCEILRTYAPSEAVLLDAGCGEGYYTSLMAQALPDAKVLAIDVSRNAMALCARRLPQAQTAVASVYALPLLEASVDVITDVFSPLSVEEYARVLRPGGLFVTVIPLEEHLFSLKEAVYDTPYRNTVKDTSLPPFTLLERRDVRYSFTLPTTEDIHHLFAMTPYYYKTSSRDQQKLDALSSLTVEAAFGILCYRK